MCGLRNIPPDPFVHPPLPSVRSHTPLWRMESSPHQDSMQLLVGEERAELEAMGHTIHRSAGHPFFLEGEPGDFALLIKKGHVKVLRGRPSRIIDIRGP